MYSNQQDININIHYTAPKEVWNIIEQVYRQMPKWIGYDNGIPYWYGTKKDENYIGASVEPSGIQFAGNGNIPQEEWEEWVALLKEKLTTALGYPIGEPEDGFEFQYYDESTSLPL